MNTQSPHSQSTTILLLLLTLLLALTLRFHRLDAQSLWNDEGTSVAVAGRDLATIARDAAHDIHPPLYYWLLHGWLWLVGDSEFAVRSLSALLGVLLAALTYALGRRLVGRWAGLAAAFLAAAHPFQVYYSQEARMYMLLAALTALVFYAALCWVGSPPRGREGWGLVYALAATAGLYTHYAFPMALLAVNLAVLLGVGLDGRAWSFAEGRRRGRQIGRWLALQVAVFLLYLPWLPIAYRQLTTWPSPTQTTPFLAALTETWRWLVFGPTIETAQVTVPLLVAALLAIVGALSLAARRRMLVMDCKSARSSRIPSSWWAAALLLLWLGLPLALMFALDLYRESYLKFLLVAAPALILLLARGLLPAPRPPPPAPRYLIPALLTISLLLPTAHALRNYYTDPAYARDDYRSIAAYVEAVGRPDDAVLLNAPGQQEVWGYYYDGPLPVHPLPESRPLDPTATEAALAEMAQPGGRVFAVLWATDESDPDRFIEGWLDANAYQALDSWYGNVRLAVYAVPERTPDAPDHELNIPLRSAETGDEIVLLGYSLPDDRLGAGDIASGDIAPITLFWRADETPTRRYKVFLHALDRGNHIVGQWDAEPGGGAKGTTLWAPGEVVADNHGLPIHPATPPGAYRVEVGLYDAETGQRLLTPDGVSQVWLEPLTVARPPAPAPIAALGMQHTVNAAFGELTLLGYDAHKLGYAHQPDAPLRAGDVLHINLYWRAEAQPGGDWQAAIDLVGAGRGEMVGLTAEPVGGYPTSRWRAGDVWRGQFNLPLPAHMPPGRYRLRVQPLAPFGPSPPPFLSPPLSVEP